MRSMSFLREITPKLNGLCVSAQDILDRSAGQIVAEIEQVR